MRRVAVILALLVAVSLPVQAQEYYRAGSVTFTGGAVANPIQFPDGTSGAPSITFASELTLGFWRSAAASVTLQGNLLLNAGSTFLASSNGSLAAAGRFYVRPTAADGSLTFQNSGFTIGSQFKFDALPTAGTCGTTPAVTAGSTALDGSINVGTATPASCIVIFGGTAYPSAPFCTANVVTSTAADTRAIGVLPTTTQLTLTPATAFANSAIVAWHCISSK